MPAGQEGRRAGVQIDPPGMEWTCGKPLGVRDGIVVGNRIFVGNGILIRRRVVVGNRFGGNLMFVK